MFQADLIKSSTSAHLQTFLGDLFKLHRGYTYQMLDHSPVGPLSPDFLTGVFPGERMRVGEAGPGKGTTIRVSWSFDAEMLVK